MPLSTQKRRGRPELDIAIRIRNWLWYSEIKKATQLSDDRLDQRYVHIQLKQGHEPIRQRVFYEIRSMGSSPDELRGYRIRKSIFEKVHEDGQFADIKFNFELPLWRYLSDPSVSAEEYCAYLNQEIECLGWFRLDARDAGIAKLALGRDEPAVKAGVNRVFSSMIHHIANMPNPLRSLCILIALFKEAYSQYELETALAIREVILSFSRYASYGTSLNDDLKYLLDKLIVDRVLSNLWIRERDFEEIRSSEKSNRKQEIRAFINWYLDPNSDARRNYQEIYPIVAKTDRTEWFVNNRDNIRKMRAPYSKIRLPRFDDPIHEDYEKSLELLKFALSKSDQTANEITAWANPPNRAGHGCLPNKRYISNSFTWLDEPEGSKFRVPSSEEF